MANSGDMIVKINSGEILKLEKNGEGIVLDSKAEDAIVRLLEIQREVDGAIEYLKSEIERQAVAYNPNFSGLKGEKIKITYSASGAKFKDTGTVRNHSKAFWTKKVTWSLDSKAIEEYRSKWYALPAGVAEVKRKKTIRISEVNNGD